MARLNYLELPVGDTGMAKRFYADAFGWRFMDFGPTYAATTTGDTDIGFQADPAQRTGAALPVIEVADIDAASGAVAGCRWSDHRPDLRLSRAGAVFISSIPMATSLP